MEELKAFITVTAPFISAFSSLGCLGAIAIIYVKLRTILKVGFDKRGALAFVLQEDCEKQTNLCAKRLKNERTADMAIVCRKIDELRATNERIFTLLDKHQDLLQRHGELIAANGKS